MILLPQEWKLAGLGIGSSSVALIEALFLLIAAKVKKMDMSFRPTMLSIREIASTFRSGLPASLDNVIARIAAAVSNNILITFFPTERFGMSLFLASIPDSVVYPLLLIAFIPHFQKLGIWYAQSFSLILGLFVSYVFLTLIAGKNNLYQCLQDEHCVNRGQ